MSPAEAIYSPLDSDRDEIRLLAITNSPTPSDLLHCRIEKTSLQDVRDEYSAHLASTSVVDKPKRKKISLWGAQHGVEEGSDAVGRYVPPASAYRFSWGDFAALSYVWGSPRDRRDIVLNGEVTSVTRNLESALRELARQDDFRGRYKLWVDALCINQDDADEKASQISKMREIYNGAWAVMTWLGEGDEESNLAFGLLFQFSTMGPEEQRELANQLSRNPEPRLTRAFYALNELMKRPYWLRLWVVQELVLGGSAAVLRCGSNLIGWTTFCAGLDVLFRRDMYTVKDELLQIENRRRGSKKKGGWHTLSLHLVHKDLWKLSRREEEGHRSLGLRRLLDIACSSECRDNRDKVFALLGMMEPEIAQALVQDYSMRTSQVFEAVAKLFITHFNNLEPLREGNPWGKTGTPSWAADWKWDGRFRYSRVESPLWGMWQKTDSREPRPEDMYSAAGNVSPNFSFPGDGLLECEGFVLDSIAGLGARANGYFNWRQRSIQQAQGWKSVYGGRAETAAAIAQTLILGYVSGGQPAENRHSAAMLHLPCTYDLGGPQFARRRWAWLLSQEDYYFRWELWRGANDTLKIGDIPLSSYFDDDIPPEAEEADYNEVYGAFDRSCKERRLMLTGRGFVGWAPDNMYGKPRDQIRVGDVICIIYGCSVPLVVRPLKDRWQVVGEAYVQGFMDGEALALLRSGGCAERVFTFC
ncbi:heterokaryon incompatibility protein-domain-containing protein [Ilyonectria robusta]|uniref:heterokaryon incompatibility protein-domain-containing protein n=1 Tax=Ilyonectria robusta TaxID=1079257 RepID=UPI001E8E3C12|nr:heterokaryon incompatibility protein-domain-containing protein [Ilyonectria robusta]KAH8670713.1 heterokaryon incompatibility protein-domain-containing protein [Ilyonectria robusta]